MHLIDFIGFIIALAALVIMFIRKKREENQRRANPQFYSREDEEREESMQEFMKSIEDNEETEPEPIHIPIKLPPLPRQTRPQNFAYKSPKEAYKPEKPVDAYKVKVPTSINVKPAEGYEVIVRKKQQSVGGALINRLGSPRDMLIIRELFGKPLAMRDPNDPQQDWNP